MRHVALLSPEFHPSNAIAAQRVVSFARYLPEFGWHPHVICLAWSENNCKTFDAGLVDSDVAQSVFRAIPYHRQGSGSRAAFGHAWSLRTQPRALVVKSANRITYRLSHLFPADYAFAGRKALQQLDSKIKLGAVMATFPMSAPLSVADWSARNLNLPWVADFRDILDQAYLVNDAKRRAHLQAKELQLLRSCSAITTVSEPLKLNLSQRHSKPIEVITNGFDPWDYRRLKDEPICKPDQLTLAYTGKLIRHHRDPTLVLKAVNSLIESGEIAPAKIRIDFYGSDSAIVDESTAGLDHVRRVVSCFPRQPRDETLRAQRNSHLLLHFSHGKEKGIMTGKIFEYLAAKVPILSVPGDGDVVDRLLVETRTGKSCDTLESLKTSLLESYRCWLTSGTIPYEADESVIAQYSRRKQAEKLSVLLDAIA